MRAWAGLEGATARRKRFGLRRHFAIAPWSDRVEVYWRDGCEAYVTPVAEDEVGVAMLWSGEGGRFECLLERFPDLARRLASAPVASRDRGAGPFHRRARAAVRGRIALVGDAAGYVDAITGEGLALAFREAQALATSVAGGGLVRYAAEARRWRRLPETLTRLLLIAERRPRLRRRLFATLERDPRLFARLLAVHCRAVPASRLGVGAAVRLAGVVVGV